MCGISLIVDKKQENISPEDIKAMNAKVRHRGPDGEGLYFDAHLALGHRALNITDFSIEGKQPMVFKDYVLIHNGEIYNYRALREQLKKEGYQFFTQSDTEVIMAAYDKWGDACVHQFMGMWAFVLYDKKKQVLFCSRDRFGIKPFCYIQSGNRFLAGSEIKQFTAFDGFVPRMNYQVAFDFLYNGKIDDTENSFFEGVKFLPAGHQLIYHLQSHTYTLSKWYDIEKINNINACDFKEASGVFKDLFTESLLLHTQTKLPIGACLSGGLDSTSIAGVAKITNTPIATFSSCYVQHDYNEIEYINEASIKYGFPGQKIYPVISDLAENGLMKRIVYHQDQPILSGSFFSEFKVFEAVSANNIRILLSGQGADEYLGGYREFSLLSLYGLLRKARLGALKNAIVNSARNNEKTVKETLKNFLLFGVGANFINKKIRAAREKSSYYGALNQQFAVKYAYQAAVPSTFSDFSGLADLSKKALFQYSLPHQLHSEDRNAMFHSVESRLPFLDHRLVEWCLSLPDDFIIRDGATKALLREGMKGVLPESIYNRHSKLGFPGPEESLFKHQYHYIQQQFQEFIDIFPEIFTKHLLEIHTAYFQHKIPYNNLLFRALSFGTWAREFGINGTRSSQSVEKDRSKASF
jgi:asparagine synthase (glutamine-hydrolysing)